ncbi:MULTISPECIES: hypothetical protein [Pseudomonas syringae group]|uniref:hypothetical protein n=1 Tax=Pseudomonas syringae group TaxID=136849 RepID=UPI000F0001FA|nr:hypothetical protein [Pseudomonas syringae group genomosp. 3]
MVTFMDIVVIRFISMSSYNIEAIICSVVGQCQWSYDDYFQYSWRLLMVMLDFRGLAEDEWFADRV